MPAQSIVTYRDVPGFPGYRVGDDGSVWSRWRRACRGWRLTDDWAELRGGLDKDGYRKLILCVNGRRWYVRINVLVLTVFVGPAPSGMLSAHNNGVRADNRLSNLRWDSQANNVADKRRHGTHQAGERHGQHKLTADQVRDIRRRKATGEPLSRLAREFGLLPSSISNVVHRRTWKDI